MYVRFVCVVPFYVVLWGRYMQAPLCNPTIEVYSHLAVIVTKDCHLQIHPSRPNPSITKNHVARPVYCRIVPAGMTMFQKKKEKKTSLYESLGRYWFFKNITFHSWKGHQFADIACCAIHFWLLHGT